MKILSPNNPSLAIWGYMTLPKIPAYSFKDSPGWPQKIPVLFVLNGHFMSNFETSLKLKVKQNTNHQTSASLNSRLRHLVIRNRQWKGELMGFACKFCHYLTKWAKRCIKTEKEREGEKAAASQTAGVGNEMNWI